MARGRLRRGLVWFSGLWLVALAVPLWPLLILTLPLVWLCCLIDAWGLKVSSTELPSAGRTVLVCGVLLATAWLIRSVVHEHYYEPLRNRGSGMAPTLVVGDYFLVLKTRDVHRGDVIAFRYPCNWAKNFIQRIVAVAGDTVEVRCSVVYINGEAISQRFHGETSYWHSDDNGPWHREAAIEYVETNGDRTYRIGHETDGSEGSRLRDHDFPRRENPFSREEALAEKGEALSRDLFGVWCEGRPELRAAALGRFARSKGDGRDPCAPRLHYIVPKGHVFVMGDNRLNSKDSRVFGPVALEDVQGKAHAVWWSRRPPQAGGVAWDRIGQRIH